MLERLAKAVQEKNIDNEVDKHLQFHQDFKKKLIARQKRIEMKLLTEENMGLLKRIQTVPPAYNRQEWEEDAKRTDKLKRTMSLYPEFYNKPENLNKSGTAGSPTRSLSMSNILGKSDTKRNMSASIPERPSGMR